MTVELITSAANPLLKDIRRAQDRGGLTASGWLIAEGPHLVAEALRSGLQIPCMIFAEDVAQNKTLQSNLRADRLVQVPRKVYQTISGTSTPQGMMALVRPPMHAPDLIDRDDSLVLVLDGIQDPGNAGTMARSAEAFGASGLIFFGDSAYPMSPKTLRASAGSLFRIPYLRQSRDLEIEGLPLFAGVADPRAPAAWDCDLTKSCAIVIGNEGAGVSAGVLSRAQPVRIPTSGVESLNAAVAASVLLYEAARQRSKGRRSMQ